MMGNFFRWLTDHKQPVNKKQKLPIACNKPDTELYSAASSGGQGKYTKYVSLSWPPLEAALSIPNLSLFLLKKTTFGEWIIKIKEIAVGAELRTS